MVIALASVLGAGVSYGAASLQTPVYQATASLYFALNHGTSASDLNQGSTYTQNQMLSFAQLATSSRVLEPVIDDLGLDATPRGLARAIEVSIPQDTVILRVTASSTSPQRAADVANAVAESLTATVLEVAPKGPEQTPTISAETIDEAVVPLFQTTPNKTRDALLGAIVGALVGIVSALLASILDTRVRNEDILAEVGAAPVLGVITRTKLLEGGGLGVVREPMGHTAEEFRRVRSALTFASISSQVRTVLVTSAAPSEGKSTVAANLALALADLRHTVLLVDADLRRPSIHRLVGIDGSVGLTSVLVGDVEAEAAGYRLPETSLDVLTAGGSPPNPAEILTSNAMLELIQAAASRYDFVVIDSPPVLSVADANLLSPLVDGVVVVANTSTRRAALAKCMKSLEGAGARILGTVLNRTKPDRGQKSYYGETR
jgi:capsular exopolysaccharide synthesis family protein